LESLGIYHQVFKNYQQSLKRISDIVTERMIHQESISLNSSNQEKEKEQRLLTVSSLRLLQGNYHHP
jgi:hypothetical protein